MRISDWSSDVCSSDLQKVFCDERGRFARLFCQSRLTLQGRPFAIRQINHSRTVEKGSVRGLHYQKAGYAESKLITCVRGAIWDAVVDLRPQSQTYLQWHAEEQIGRASCRERVCK